MEILLILVIAWNVGLTGEVVQHKQIIEKQQKVIEAYDGDATRMELAKINLDNERYKLEKIQVIY